MDAYSIGIDLGGTNLRAAAIDKDGKMLAKISGSTPVASGPGPVVDDMAEAVEKLRDKFGRDGLAGIGAGVPGNIDMAKGVIVGWGNMPIFNGYAMRDELSKRLGTKVILENDANAAALGEQWMGAGRGVDDLVLLTLGTGIGGGIIADGRILHGQIGMAGEVGHITISPNGNPCGCGNRGCVEKHASATAISAMARLLGLGHDLTAQQVYDLARHTDQPGNDRAREIFKVMGEALGIALAALINIFNFPLFLLGGGVVAAWEFFAPAMLAEVERRSFTYRSTLKTMPTRIEAAKLGGDAGLYGAACLQLQDVRR
ncbi:MAG TPA: ROK family protein [Bryobacteraceae bacterium]|jgi:glucokinase|nr:ROK family protein [Bryobacteraceae bacterium]